MRQLAFVYDSLQGTVDFVGKHGCFTERHIFNCFLVAFLLFTVLAGSRAGGWLRGLSKKAALLLSLACVGLLLISSLVYAATRGYSDHAEPAVIAISTLWGHGKPLYPGMDSAERYGLVYGPMAYITNAIAISVFGTDIHVVKLLGLAFLMSSFVLLGAALSRRRPYFTRAEATLTRSVSEARKSFPRLRFGLVWMVTFLPSQSIIAICWGYAAIGLLMLERSVLSRPLASWVRSDPQLLFWATVGLFCATRKRPLVAILGTGFAVGMCVNLKLHGAAYVFPALFILYRNVGVRKILVCLVCALVVALAPFLVFPNVSLTSFLGFLRIVARHGLTAEESLRVAEYALFLLLPVVAVFGINLMSCNAQDFRCCFREQGALLAVVLLATIAVSVPASTPGAGPHHLLPLVPSYAFVLGSFVSWPRGAQTAPNWALHLALSAVCVFGIIGAAEATCCAHAVCGMSRYNHRIAKTAEDEIDRIRGLYPRARIGMGYGSLDKYDWTFYRTTLPLTGSPYLLDSATIMDLVKAGSSLPKATRQAIQDGQIDIWLVPAGDEPFTMPSFFVGDPPLFDRQFRDEFHACYQRQPGTEHFDLWVYRSAEASSFGVPRNAALRAAENNTAAAGARR